MESKEMAVKMDNVNKRIQHNLILSNISLSIPKGRIYGLIGSNGAGKSMLLKVICGLVDVDAGEVSVFGNQVGHGRTAHQTAIVTEHPGLIDNMTAYENLSLLASSCFERSNIRPCLSRFGINPFDKRTVKKYSLGMRQKVAIAQAFFILPQLLLLDEPTSNLDESSCIMLRDEIQSINMELGTTCIITCHQKVFLENICHRFLYISNGSLIESKEMWR